MTKITCTSYKELVAKRDKLEAEGKQVLANVNHKKKEYWLEVEE